MKTWVERVEEFLLAVRHSPRVYADLRLAAGQLLHEYQKQGGVTIDGQVKPDQVAKIKEWVTAHSNPKGWEEFPPVNVWAKLSDAQIEQAYQNWLKSSTAPKELA